MRVEGFVLCTVGTRCRDGIKVLWCRSHLVWLIFEGSIPRCACLRLANILVVTCFCCFFFCCCCSFLSLLSVFFEANRTPSGKKIVAWKLLGYLVCLAEAYYNRAIVEQGVKSS